MKICITAQGDNLDSKVESRFGRSPYFIIYDTESSNFEVIENPNIEASSGVGIQSGQLMADKKVEVVLTGKVGPKASHTLAAAGIKVIAVTAEIVREAIDQYQGGEGPIITEEEKEMNNISETQNVPPSDSWFGRTCRQVFGGGRGAGIGGGRGMGRGQGRGLGNGCGAGRGQGSGRRGFAGPSGYCVCPKCGEKIEHQPGVPCRSNNCPKCGTVMTRE